MLKRIRIQNFKSIRDVEVELGSLTVLVGRSGTGKSNFVGAIRFLRDYLAWGDRAPHAHGGWRYVMPAQTGRAPRFTVTFDVPGEPDEFTYFIAFQNSSPDQSNPSVALESEGLEFRGTKVFFQQGRNWVNKPNMANLPQAGQVALGKLKAISEAHIAFTALTNSIGCYDFVGDVGATAKDEFNRSPQVLMARNSGVQQISSSLGLLDDASNFVSVAASLLGGLYHLSLKKSIVASLATINPSVTSIELDNVQNPSAISVTHRIGAQPLSLELAQESDGFRRFFTHLLALYQQPPKLTLLFENPENGVYPGALALLADEFKAAPGDARGQILLTTHSPEFLNNFDDIECLRVVTIKDHETSIGRVSHEQAESVREGLLTTGELLTVDPARAESAEAAPA